VDSPAVRPPFGNLLLDDVAAAEIARHLHLRQYVPAFLELRLFRIGLGEMAARAVLAEQRLAARGLHLGVVRLAGYTRGVHGGRRGHEQTNHPRGSHPLPRLDSLSETGSNHLGHRPGTALEPRNDTTDNL